MMDALQILVLEGPTQADVDVANEIKVSGLFVESFLFEERFLTSKTHICKIRSWHVCEDTSFKSIIPNS